MRLEGKVAVVTGAASGIGKAIALGYAREGARVVVADLDEAGAQDTVREIAATSGAARALRVDLSRLEEVQALPQRVAEALGRIDILVNNAGVSTRESIFEVTEQSWERTMAVNLKAVFFASVACAREMMKTGGGKIVNIASVAGVANFRPVSPQYQISKAGILQLTRVLAVELAPYHINVNAIGPGTTITPMTQAGLTTDTYREYLTRGIPLGRLALPEDMVGAAIFLASAEADYITGQTIFVEGGALSSYVGRPVWTPPA